MQCPVCHQDQVIVEWNGVELDLCADGHGIWFDADELRQLFARGAGDDGHAGLLHDFEERLERLPEGEHGPKRRCPRCDARMRHVAAPGSRGADGTEPPVVLDACPHGHGLWFDENELEQVLTLASETAEDVEGLAAVRDFLDGFSRPGSGATPNGTDTDKKDEA